jgi:hypothetical protein
MLKNRGGRLGRNPEQVKREVKTRRVFYEFGNLSIWAFKNLIIRGLAESAGLIVERFVF